jgi:hypothetical protein
VERMGAAPMRTLQQRHLVWENVITVVALHDGVQQIAEVCRALVDVTRHTLRRHTRQLRQRDHRLAAVDQEARQLSPPLPLVGVLLEAGAERVGVTLRVLQLPEALANFEYGVDSAAWPRSPESEHNCDKWIVTTTISAATNNLRWLGKVAGWCTVIVLDERSPDDFHIPGAVVLSVADQVWL